MFCLLGVLAATPLLMAAGPSAGNQGKATKPQDKNTSAGAPSVAAQAYLVVTARSLDETVKGLGSANALKNLISSNDLSCRVYIQHEKDVSTNQAEVHDGADDIFIIMEGTATFVLGGKLDSPKESQPGEWRASGITGGREFKVSKGDVIIVPRGTPHRRITAGQDVAFIVIKSSAPPNK